MINLAMASLKTRYMWYGYFFCMKNHMINISDNKRTVSYF